MDAQELKDWQQANNYSNVALAEALSVTRASVGAWRRGGDLRPIVALAINALPPKPPKPPKPAYACSTQPDPDLP